jgi:23S rRNA (uracil1939-C5)-methyltransferase
MNQATSRSNNEAISHEVTITDLNHDGYGVARLDGKVVFISGALPGEVVTFRYAGRRRKKFDYAVVDQILSPSPDRVTPRCRYFGVCGGCSLQHMSAQTQIQWKQNTLKENLQRIAGIEPGNWLPPLTASAWGYRRKARLGAKFVAKKGGILIGFREKQSSLINDLQECHVLDERAAVLLPGLHSLLNEITCNNKIPQIEISAGDNKIAFIIRHLVPFTSDDENRLIEFAKNNCIELYRQPKGPDNIIPLWESSDAPLEYKIDRDDITIQFRPASFTQVNNDINQKMISRVLEVLELDNNDRVLDLFCGLGNFTLPVARHAGKVTGIEGDDILVHGARDNASLNHVTNADFMNADLFDENKMPDYIHGDYNKLLLDPPRSGAREVVTAIEPGLFEKIVYVSCNPSTLARDTEILVKQKGYTLVHAGVMDMFPHTNHVESMAVFERKTKQSD